MTLSDSRGLAVSTTSDEAAAHYRDGIDLLLSAWPGAAEALDAAITTDPDFALARAARARLHAIRAEGAEARVAIAEAAEVVARRGDARERSHVAVLAAAIGGRSAEALERALAHLEAWPRDALIFSLPLGAFGLLAFSGRADHDAARADLCDAHARHFADDDWWFLTYRGWSHTENGDVARGRAFTERGFALREANANAAHALSHALYERGAHDEAEELIDGWLPAYDRSGVLHGHIAWHAALGALERGDAAAALALYDARIRPAVSTAPPLNALTDAASLLWRLDAYGHAVPAERWPEVAAYADDRFPKAGLAFADVHAALAAAATGNRARVEDRVAALGALVEAGTLAAGPVVPALCRAALAFAQADHAGCLRMLEPIADEVVRIGGSGAQRELFEDMRLLALMRSGETDRARTLLDERLHRRPSVRDANWRHGRAV